MKTKTILGISLTAAFAVSMIFAQQAMAGMPAPAVAESATVQINGDEIRSVINTDKKIMKDGSDSLFGFGILTNGGENVLALTSHICAADSLVQNNAPNKTCPSQIGLLDVLVGPGSDAKHDGPQWHAHVLDLHTDFDAFCAQVPGVTHQVNLTSSLSNNLSPGPRDHYIVNVNEDPDRIKIRAPLGGNNAAAPTIEDDVIIASYQIAGNATEAGIISDLCLYNTSLLFGNSDDVDVEILD